MRFFTHSLPCASFPLVHCLERQWCLSRRAMYSLQAASSVCMSKVHCAWNIVFISHHPGAPSAPYAYDLVQGWRSCTINSAHAVTTESDTAREQASAQTASKLRERELNLYNTMSGRKERVQPQHGQGNKISMYCCGVTVYDLSHIGDSAIGLQLAPYCLAAAGRLYSLKVVTLQAVQVMLACTAASTFCFACCDIWGMKHSMSGTSQI